MLDQHTFGIQDTQPPQTWRQRNRPALVAAAWFWLFFLILALISLFTGWASLPVTLGLQLLLSLGAGVLAARLHRRQTAADPNYVHQGALAGFYLPLTTAAVILVVALVAGIGSLGTLLPLMIPYFVALPVELGMCSALGALGARLYQKLAHA